MVRQTRAYKCFNEQQVLTNHEQVRAPGWLPSNIVKTFIIIDCLKFINTNNRYRKIGRWKPHFVFIFSFFKKWFRGFDYPRRILLYEHILENILHIAYYHAPSMCSCVDWSFKGKCPTWWNIFRLLFWILIPFLQITNVARMTLCIHLPLYIIKIYSSQSITHCYQRFTAGKSLQ